MQEDADLEDEEKVLVEKLRAEFFPGDGGPRGEEEEEEEEEAPGASQTQTESPAEDAKPPGEDIPR